VPGPNADTENCRRLHAGNLRAVERRIEDKTPTPEQQANNEWDRVMRTPMSKEQKSQAAIDIDAREKVAAAAQDRADEDALNAIRQPEIPAGCLQRNPNP
jgi:hypothetical protein